MIEGKYKWNYRKRWLKPVSKQSQIHSIALGDLQYRIFVNFKGKNKINDSIPTVYQKVVNKEGDDYIAFLYKNMLFVYLEPFTTGEIIEVKRLK